MKESLFWSVKSPEGSRESFVLGTMHRCPQYVFEKLSFLGEYLEKVEGTVFETDLSGAAENISELSLLPENKVLSDFMSQRAYAKLRDKTRKYFQLDVDSLSGMRPMFIHALLQERWLGANTVSMDESIYRQAKGRGLRVMGLESQTNYLRIFDSIKIADEIGQLSGTVKNISKSKSKLTSLEKAYFNEDIQELYKMTKRGVGKYRQVLLYDRNRFFIERLCEILKENTFLACVGAGHLAGKSGILKGLKDYGYKVKPLKPKDR